MELTIGQLQQLEFEMVQAVTAVCAHHGIPCFLHAGSALGAVRHGGPIPWDYDTDMLVPEPDIPRFVTAVSAELPDKFYLDFYKEDPHYYSLFPRIGLKGYKTDVLHVDIFRMIGAPSDRYAQERLIRRTRRLRVMFRAKVRPVKKGDWKHVLLKALLLPFTRRHIIRDFGRLCAETPFQQAEYVTNPFGRYGMKNMFKKEVFGEGHEVSYRGYPVKIAEQYDFYLRQYYGDYMKLPPEAEREAALQKTYTVEEAK